MQIFPTTEAAFTAMNVHALEGLQALLFDILLAAEQGGFQLGVKIFAKLLIEMLS